MTTLVISVVSCNLGATRRVYRKIAVSFSEHLLKVLFCAIELSCGFLVKRVSHGVPFPVMLVKLCEP